MLVSLLLPMAIAVAYFSSDVRAAFPAPLSVLPPGHAAAAERARGGGRRGGQCEASVCVRSLRSPHASLRQAVWGAVPRWWRVCVGGRAQNSSMSLYDFLRQTFLSTGVNDPNRQYWVYMIYVFLSANWDAMLLLVATVFIRWHQWVCGRARAADGSRVATKGRGRADAKAIRALGRSARACAIGRPAKRSRPSSRPASARACGPKSCWSCTTTSLTRSRLKRFPWMTSYVSASRRSNRPPPLSSCAPGARLRLTRWWWPWGGRAE